MILGIGLLIAAGLMLRQRRGGWSAAGLAFLGVWLAFPSLLALLPDILASLWSSFIAMGGASVLGALAMVGAGIWAIRKMSSN